MSRRRYSIRKILRFFLPLFLLIGVGVFLFNRYACQDSGIRKQQSAELGFRVMTADSIYKNLESKKLRRQQKKLDSIFSKLQKTNGFNGTVLFAEKGRIIFQKAYGYADVRRRKGLLTLDSQFGLASVSKMFTATAIMILHEEGKLNYDDDVRKYIPEWPYEGVTIRNLLNHRSGMPRYEVLADEKWSDQSVPLFNEDMIRLFVVHRPESYFKPDGGFHYCNTNFALLGSVVERVSKRNFEDFMHDRVFEPAGMRHSFIYSLRGLAQLPENIDRGVPGFDARRKGFIEVPNNYLNGVMGDKIMYSTVGDLFQFDKALYNEVLVKAATLKEAFTPGSENRRRTADNYGFGWRTRADADSTVYHYGWWKGFRTFFIRDMNQQRTLIVLTNKDKGPGSEHLWEIIEDQKFKLFPSSVNMQFERDRGLWQ
ncbi:MAG: beta-lactamase family protein [Bacteroidales bacterium]|nr:beta-lactamase family protein [Bacteroidales bacterium]